MKINVLIIKLIVFPILILNTGISAQTPSLPLIGAQVFIEPGQTPGDVENWFRILNLAGMTVCRIRMFETHMHRPDGSWDFSLYDNAFRAAEKYGVKIFATLFPADSKNSVGGEKFPESEQHLKQISEYIKNIVSHFRQYGALYAWVLQNEPGNGGNMPDNAFARDSFRRWKEKQVSPIYSSKGYMTESFETKRFVRDYETWFLGWIAAEIKKYDPDRPLHVNNHQIFENVAEYDFPSWRKFLTTLGASAHPSWHFGYFNRNQYAVALAANCDIIRSGAGNIPFWITELQGGNNIYSGNVPICPTKEEITQWLWTGIMSGADGIIFWTLNPRGTADEAGEWAMITFQNEPSDRLTAASKVIKTLASNPGIFSNTVPIESNIHILYSRESLWAESRSQMRGEKIEGRSAGGVMKSALAYYEALSENGIGCNFGEMNEFDWSKNNYERNTIILAHQISIPSVYWEKLEGFVNRGGKLVVSGLTGFFDENMHNIMKTGFPLEKLFGGNLREVIHVGDKFEIELENPELQLPAHLWRGTIKNNTADIIGTWGYEIIATRNHFGRGEVVWIPSLIGLGARRVNNQPLSELLRVEADQSISDIPVRFKKQEPGVMMRTLRSGKSLLSVVINKNPERRNIEIETTGNLKPVLLFADKSGMILGNNICSIGSEETIVIKWE